MNNSRIKVLIVGLGKIGLTYDINLSSDRYILSYVRACSLDKRYELLGCVDSSANARKALLAEYETPIFDSLEAAFLAVSPELVIIATPTENHESAIRIVAKKASVKVVLSEKPLADNVEGALACAKCCESNGKILLVNFMRRVVTPLTDLLFDFREKNLPGRIGGSVHYSGGFLHNGSHFIDLLVLLFGKVHSHELVRKRPCGTDWMVDVVLHFSSASIYFLSSDYHEDLIGVTNHEVDLIGSCDRITLRNGGRVIQKYTAGDDQVFNNIKTFSERENFSLDAMNKFMAYVLDDMWEEFSFGKSKSTKAIEFVYIMKLIDSIIKESK